MPATLVEAISSELAIDRDFRRHYITRYKVVMDVKQAGPQEVLLSAGIPARRSTYAWPPPPAVALETDLWAFATEASAVLFQADASNKVWIVSVPFDSPDPVFGGGRRPDAVVMDDPVDELPIFGGSFITFPRIRTLDRDQQPLKYTNELPIDITEEQHQDTLTIELNTATISLQQRNNAIDTVNDATFWGYAANVIRLVGWEYSIIYYGPADTPYVSHRFTFQFSIAQQWRTRVESRHTHEMIDSSGATPGDKWSHMSISGGDLGDVPVSHGLPLASTGLFKPGINATGDILVFNMFDEFDFTTLPIPQTLPNPPFLPFA